MNGIWALKPYYLGPWTLKGTIYLHVNPEPACHETSSDFRGQGHVEALSAENLGKCAEVLLGFRVLGHRDT